MPIVIYNKLSMRVINWNDNMENIIVLAILAGVFIQIMMIVKFFQMSSDIRDMKYMMEYAIQKIGKSQLELEEEKEKKRELQQKIENDSKKLKWQMWMYIVIGILSFLLYFLG